MDRMDGKDREDGWDGMGWIRMDKDGWDG